MVLKKPTKRGFFYIDFDNDNNTKTISVSDIFLYHSQEKNYVDINFEIIIMVKKTICTIIKKRDSPLK